MGKASKSGMTYLDSFKCPECGHTRKVRRRIASAGRYIETQCDQRGCYATSDVKAGRPTYED